ncbi:hypothetical protein D7X94_16155 [Acutalibacter sp. 1XD8-33]|nr:hypothetical protein D7X94_16155 [Acutalibacter sp. 1XD8-33]
MLAIIALVLSAFSLALNSVMLVRLLRKLIYSWRLLGKGYDRDDEGGIEYGTQRPSLDTAIRIADILGMKSYEDFKKIFR